jgi:hypothetical protein
MSDRDVTPPAVLGAMTGYRKGSERTMIIETIKRSWLEEYKPMSFSKLKEAMTHNSGKKENIELNNLDSAIALLYYIHEKEEDGE